MIIIINDDYDNCYYLLRMITTTIIIQVNQSFYHWL